MGSRKTWNPALVLLKIWSEWEEDKEQIALYKTGEMEALRAISNSRKDKTKYDWEMNMMSAERNAGVQNDEVLH